MADAKGPPGFNLMAKPGMSGLVAEGDWHGHLVSVSACEEDQQGAVAVLANLYRDWPKWAARIVEAMAAKDLTASATEFEAISAYVGGYFEIELSAPEAFGRGVALAVGTIEAGIEDVGTGG
ncbi:hypothetical protein [Altererythrobacter aquiaggeris]|uniref:hypothetical protein n=1 Tax=Aestuarierythrobacter aquiaggeris TaxID=1898396 RepID=UPI00301A2180